MEDRLQKFAHVADAGSFTKASRELHISQPALSAAIAKLERELRTQLYLHGVRPLTLTPAGRLAYETGRDIGLKTSNLKTLLAEAAHRQLAVRLGMIDSVADALFAQADSAAELERQASVSLVVDNSRKLVDAVENGQLDMAFVVERQLSHLLEATQTAAEPLAVVCNATQREAVVADVRGGRLPRFISYDQASTTHQLVAEALERQKIAINPTFYSTSPEVMLRLVLLEKGVAALPYLLVREQLAEGLLSLVGSPPLFIERHIQAVKRRGAVLPAALTRIARQVCTLLGAVQSEASSLR